MGYRAITSLTRWATAAAASLPSTVIVRLGAAEMGTGEASCLSRVRAMQ